MKITFEHYGEKHSVELDGDDQQLAKVMQKICYLLEAAGWPRSSVIGLFNPEDADIMENNPFDWSIE